MRVSQKYAAWRFLPRIVALMATLLLAACDGTGTSGSTATPTPKPPTLTQAVAMRTYTGPGFTMRYPANWIPAEYGSVSFVDPTGTYDLLIFSKPNPNGLVSPEKIADNGIAGLINMQPVPIPTMPPTITLGGQTWSQRAVLANSIWGRKSVRVELVTLVTNYPVQSADTKSYSIIYSTLPSLFDQASNRYFMPMLRSFKFTV